MTEDVRTDVRIHESAEVHPDAVVGAGTAIWNGTAVREGVRIGSDCQLGRNVYVDHDVVIGDRVKIQNQCLVYTPARIDDGAFLGPAVVLTNDRYPRSVTPSGEYKGVQDWTADGVVVEEGASIGARSVVVAGVTIGRYALVGAGSVVTRSLPAYALAYGNPAKRVGWVGAAGVPLKAEPDGGWRCPATGDAYDEKDGTLLPRR